MQNQCQIFLRCDWCNFSIDGRELFSSKVTAITLCVAEPAMIIYISRGLLNTLTEAKRVMSTIASENARLANKVIINTYAVIDGKK